MSALPSFRFLIAATAEGVLKKKAEPEGAFVGCEQAEGEGERERGREEGIG